MEEFLVCFNDLNAHGVLAQNTVRIEAASSEDAKFVFLGILNQNREPAGRLTYADVNSIVVGIYSSKWSDA